MKTWQLGTVLRRRALKESRKQSWVLERYQGEKERCYWILGGIDDALSVTSFAISHSSLSEPPARSEMVPGGRLIKGSDFCAAILAQNWPALHRKLEMSFLLACGKVSHAAGNEEEGWKDRNGIQSSAPIGVTDVLIDWDYSCPNKTLDSAGCVFRLSSVFKNPLISCTVCCFLHNSYHQWLTPFSSFLF